MKLNKLWVGLAIATSLVCFVPRSVWPTVSNTVVSTTTGYGNGVTTSFPITFDFRSNSWVTVTRYDTSVTPTSATVISQGAGASKFTVTGGNPGTAVLMGTAPTSTQYLVIARSIPLTQPVVLNPASIFPYQGLSSQLDQVTLTLQNLNANGGTGGGSSGGGSGGSANLPSPGAAYDLIGWNSAAASTVNATVAYDAGKSTFQVGDILKFNGSGWATYPFTQTNLIQTLNGSPNTPLAAASGGSGVTNAGTMTWGSNAITLTTTGTTNLTLPTSGTVITGTTDNNNTANTIVKRDSSGNFSSNVITANSFVGPVAGAVTGNVTGNVTGTAANVTGIVALGNGGTGQTTRQGAINGLLNTSGGVSGQFARFDGTNVTLDTIHVGDVPQGFSRLKLAQGDANVLLANDSSGNMSVIAGVSSGDFLKFNGVKWVSASGGTSSPGGSSGQIQYNNAGSFAGDSGFTTNGAGSVTAASVVTTSLVIPGSTTGYVWTALDGSGDAHWASAQSPLSFINSLTNSGGNVSLVNDSGAPGNSKYYGTNSSGTQGYFTLPTGFTNPMSTLGDIIYEDATPTAARLAGNTTSTKKFLSQTGTGAVSAVPAWGQPAFTDITGSVAASQLPNPTSSTLGGIESYAAVSNQWINAISTSGVPSSTQPAFTNISGNLATAQLPTAQTWPASGTVQATTPNNHGVLVSGSGATATVIAPDSSTTKVLTSGGSSADPTWSVPLLAVQGQYDTGTTNASTIQVPYNQATTIGTNINLFETGNKNLLLNPSFEATTFSTSWTVTTVTGAVETSIIVDGRKSAKLTYSSQTGGIKQSVTPTVHTVSVNYEASCSVNTTMATIEVCGLAGGVSQNCTAVPASGTWQKVATNFVGPANGTSVGVNIDTTASGSGAVYVDDCYVGPARNLGQSQVNTPWVAYTPTFTGFGTVTVSSFWWRRIGDSLQVKGRFTPGTTTATEARISFPNSYVADSAKMHGTSELCGSIARAPAGGSFNTLSAICEPSVSYFTIGIYSGGTAYAGGASGPMIKMLGNTLISSGEDESVFLQIPVTAFSDQSIYRPDATPASWAGYQTVSGGCSTTSTTYADTSACTSIAVTQQQNRNFGTVATAGSSLPGVTFTPPRSGNYLVCASGTVSSTLAATASVRMTDGTNVLHNGVSVTNSALGDGVFSLCGTENVSAIASTTIKLQLATSTSTSSIVNGTASGSSAIQWSIVELDAPMPAPYLTGTVTSSTTAQERVERAEFGGSGGSYNSPAACTSTCSAYSQSGSWISGVTRTATGTYTVSFTAGEFTSPPQCTMAAMELVSAGTRCVINDASPTTSQVLVVCRSGSSTLTDDGVNLICMGPH